jgi:uncharacterized protein
VGARSRLTIASSGSSRCPDVHVVIAGGTGFLGSALVSSFRAAGHAVTILSRRPKALGEVAWSLAENEGQWTSTIDGCDAVVNLAGEPLDAGRWTDVRKASILDSRVRATRALVKAIARASRPPQVLLNASAIGIYGRRGAEAITEATAAADDFLARVCVAWEREALVAGSVARVVLLRTGLVLDRTDGALSRLALPFKLFAGGPVGSGRQWWSWIHVVDWVSMVRWALESQTVSGPINLTAPTPVTNRDFARALGSVLGRPSVISTPGFALRLALGEMADALILSGQRVVPAKAVEHGFHFRYATLHDALRAIYAA